MQRLLNDAWTFVKLPLGSSREDALAAGFEPVDLPHDFLIGNVADLYENCDGWYRRTLDVPAMWTEQVCLLRFDGVYMDCDVLVNGQVVCSHAYGYTAFDANLTPAIHAGENEVMVHIRHQSPNSRWYSGAGIFRDVTLCVGERNHIDPNSVYIHSRHLNDEAQWEIWVDIDDSFTGNVKLRVLNQDGRPVLIAHDSCDCASASHGYDHVFHLPDAVARRWNLDDPFLYTLEVTLGEQMITHRFGLREVEMNPDTGLYVNGRPIKLHGVCLHHDLGALGAAFHEKAARRQLKAMKDMGVNALRTSHNPPASKMLDLCDEMGILVIDELLDMWEGAKTTYDYARFFDEHIDEDVKSWVCRDRNHPCVIMWSIGNEIYDTHVSSRGQEVTNLLKSLVEEYDPNGNAIPTIGSNYMPWEGAQKCADILKIAGYNYAEKYYDEHHAAHPDWVIYGSETASSLSSRGIYRFPIDTNILSDEDLQCSALGNSTSSWGCRDLRKMIVDDLNTPYSMGQFIWSGIDYIGEPTPYHTRSCYFGHMDTAVFPKDGFYQFKAAWNKEKMVHIGVYWDWNEGQLIDVPVMTNGAFCELLLNGRSLGVKQVSMKNWQESLPTWRVPYEAGDLCARAYDVEGRLIAEDHARSFGDSASLHLEAEDAQLLADGHDMTFMTVTARDASGNPVENAADCIHVSVTGAGRLLGVDNGDSTDKDGYKTNVRRLFSGKLLIMIGALDAPGTVRVEVTSPGLKAATLEIPVVTASKRPGISCGERIAERDVSREKWVRRIDMRPLSTTHLNAENRSVTFAISVLPEDADPQELTFRITNNAGIASPCADVTRNADGTVTVTAKGDGAVYLRGTCRNGYPHTRVISQQEIFIEGIGQPYLNPYELVAGGLYDLHEGEISAGNEQGISFARDGESMAGFTNVDFGLVGSDEITLPIFALNGEKYEITVWRGDPRHGGEKVAVLPYQKPSIWNTYQAETYRLPVRFRGVETICFSMRVKVHLKGFSFTKQSRAWVPQSALEADTVYGDSFTRTADGIVNIGNNVSLVYENMDFGNITSVRLTLDGTTFLPENPVTIRMQNEAGNELQELCNFKGGAARGEQTFSIRVLPGICKVSFVFLPGSQFDFYGFRFEK